LRRAFTTSLYVVAVAVLVWAVAVQAVTELFLRGLFQVVRTKA
jgi:hypothetical protein